MTEVLSKPNLQSLAKSLLNQALTKPEMKVIVEDIYQHFLTATGVSGYSKEASFKTAVTATTGVAISINHTARCLLDYQRTTQFLRATVRAIQQQQQAYPGDIIRVLYAGCGPYAPFFTLVAPMFSAQEVQFTLLEINELSLHKAEQLSEHLELTDYVHAYRQADATTYQVPAEEHYHVLFSETLDAVLLRECFVPILWNLRPQLPEDHILIPQNVIVHAAVVNKNNFPNGNSDVRDPAIDYPEQKIGEVFNVATDLAPYLTTDSLPDHFPAKHLPIERADQYDYLVLYTDVQVLDDLWLHRGSGLLTEPLLTSLGEVLIGGGITFRYHLQPEVIIKMG